MYMNVYIYPPSPWAPLTQKKLIASSKDIIKDRQSVKEFCYFKNELTTLFTKNSKKQFI